MVEKLDIRHMRVLLHLVRERNVSKVARKLDISQQAVSAYLKRMREIFPQELFLRLSAGLQPTEYAYELAAKIEKIIDDVDAIFGDFPFDPLASEQVFTIIANEYSQLSIIPKLSLKLARLAPKIRLDIIDFNPSQHFQTLANGEADLVIGFSDYVDDGLIRTKLRQDHYCCVVGRNSSLTDKISCLEDTSRFPHVDFSSSPGNLGNRVGDFLDARNIKRRVVATMPCYTSLQAFMSVNDAVAFVPSAIASTGDFQVIDMKALPLRFDVAVGWHRRAAGIVSRQWLTGVIADVVSN
ncbi:LysR family transcriptional regulator [Burkholderia stagnalis]|uniref:LysR family transcriptional regulator n=1 Tax=Burkholderia stagnalis TaxID=1503054 RepID=UPI0018C7CAF4|nr:LysR family transcriptional regulator [Burkholderia stagnalis]